jgi:hypothetical protein
VVEDNNLKVQMRNVDPTVENLSADPTHFIPALAFIIEGKVELLYNVFDFTKFGFGR